MQTPGCVPHPTDPSLMFNWNLPIDTLGNRETSAWVDQSTIHVKDKMLKKLFITGFNLALLTVTVAACTPPSETAAPGNGEATESMVGRSTYGEISLPPEPQRFGTDPEQIVLDAFGLETPREGNFNQEVTLVEQTSERAIAMLTQTGLLDDSVEGIRYWVEFEAGENAWEMVWAGRQVRCYAGRGSQDWTTELCI